nr:Cthe_2314 family HEPN domain-containing protein [uncultured Vibrio sp.]
MKCSDNKNIQILYKYAAEYLLGGLSAIEASESSFHATEVQKYSHDLVSRAAEIDNAFESLKISIEFLKKRDFPDSKFDFISIHSYHIENFLLRLTTIIDRCHLFAGTTLLLKNKEIEKNGGNRIVMKELKGFSPQSVSTLKKMDKVVGKLRKHRNKIAHQAGYSSKNLIALHIYETANDEFKSKFKEVMPFEELKEVVIDETENLLTPIVPKLHRLVDEFIDSLAFVFVDLVDKNT